MYNLQSKISTFMFEGMLPFLFWFVIIAIVIISTIHQKRKQQRFVQQTTEKLHSRDWKVRQRTVHELGAEFKDSPNYSPDCLVELILRVAHDREMYVRKTGIVVLSNQIGVKLRQGKSKILAISASMQSFVTNVFIQALSDHEPEIRRAAVIALAKHQETGVFQKLFGSSGSIDVIHYLLQALQDQDATVRKEAVAGLGKQEDSRSLYPILDALQDQNEQVRAEAASALKTFETPQILPPLLDALHDESKRVSWNAATTLRETVNVVRSVVFKTGGAGFTGIADPAHTLYNPDVSGLTVSMSKLKHILIESDHCNLEYVETFSTYMSTYLDRSHLKRHVALSIHGDPTKFSSTMYEVWNRCERIEVFIETIIFGSEHAPFHSAHLTLCNPDMAQFTLPLPHLQQVLIYTAHYDFHRVERFQTYALNYIGQKHLRKTVEVHLYGDPNALHSNLYNNFRGFFKDVIHAST